MLVVANAVTAYSARIVMFSVVGWVVLNAVTAQRAARIVMFSVVSVCGCMGVFVTNVHYHS